MGFPAHKHYVLYEEKYGVGILGPFDSLDKQNDAIDNMPPNMGGSFMISMTVDTNGEIEVELV